MGVLIWSMHISKAVIFPTMKKLTLAGLLMLCVTACGGSSGGNMPLQPSNNTNTQSASMTSDTTLTSSSTQEAAATNLTALILTNRSADCADYEGTYSAQALDVGNSVAFTAAVSISASEDTCSLVSNNIPNHDFNDGERSFPNDAEEVSRDLVILRSPQQADANTQLSRTLINAVLLNGAVVDILSAGCWDMSSGRNVAVGCSTDADWLIDPVGSGGFFGEDSHNAHVQPGGSYHYHGDPKTLFDDFPGPNGSPVIGFAADGFPIYGPFFLDEATGQLRKAISGYTLKVGNRVGGPGGTHDGFYVQDFLYTGSGDLDECNGMTVNEQYGYYVTASYPWIMNCYKGTPHFSFRK